MIFSQQFENCPVVLRTIVPLIGKIGNILAYNFLANASQRQLAEELRACQTHTGRTRATTKGASKRTCSKHVDTFNVGVPNSQGQSRKDWTANGVRNFKNWAVSMFEPIGALTIGPDTGSQRMWCQPHARHMRVPCGCHLGLDGCSRQLSLGHDLLTWTRRLPIKRIGVVSKQMCILLKRVTLLQRVNGPLQLFDIRPHAARNGHCARTRCGKWGNTVATEPNSTNVIYRPDAEEEQFLQQRTRELQHF
jgi:hypothetical protein